MSLWFLKVEVNLILVLNSDNEWHFISVPRNTLCVQNICYQYKMKGSVANLYFLVYKK